MDSTKIKDLLIQRCSFGNGYVGAVHETVNCNNADVVAVKFGGKVQEFEIKVSRADLIGELRCARVAAGLEQLTDYTKKRVQQAMFDTPDMTDEQKEVLLKHGHGLSKTKLEKHRFYLDPEHKQEPNRYYQSLNWTPPKRFVPHTFYWCIPNDLLEICRELNRGLPYGIYVYDLPQTSKYYQKFIVRAGRSLGGQGDGLYFDLFNRACTLWAESRGKAEYLQRELDEKQKKA